MIPLSGILSRAFSIRALFFASCAGFTADWDFSDLLVP